MHHTLLFWLDVKAVGFALRKKENPRIISSPTLTINKNRSSPYNRLILSPHIKKTDLKMQPLKLFVLLLMYHNKNRKPQRNNKICESQKIKYVMIQMHEME